MSSSCISSNGGSSRKPNIRCGLTELLFSITGNALLTSADLTGPKLSRVGSAAAWRQKRRDCWERSCCIFITVSFFITGRGGKTASHWSWGCCRHWITAGWTLQTVDDEIFQSSALWKGVKLRLCRTLSEDGDWSVEELPLTSHLSSRVFPENPETYLFSHSLFQSIWFDHTLLKK